MKSLVAITINVFRTQEQEKTDRFQIWFVYLPSIWNKATIEHNF